MRALKIFKLKTAYLFLIACLLDGTVPLSAWWLSPTDGHPGGNQALYSVLVFSGIVLGVVFGIAAAVKFRSEHTGIKRLLAIPLGLLTILLALAAYISIIPIACRTGC